MKYFVTIILILLFAVAVHAQCSVPAGYVCITQSAANQMAANLDELKNSRDTIAKFLIERATNAAELAAANKVIEGWKALDAINATMIQKYEAVAKMYENVIKLQADLIEKLTAKINAPKSAWSQFLSALKTVASFAMGVLIGRGVGL